MKATFRALNGLRFFAAFAVVCYHYAGSTTSFQNGPQFLKNLVQAGPIALSFFYILSGFVLTHAYHDRIPATPSSRKSFWYARVARLYPVYVLAFVLFLPMAWEKYIRHSDVAAHGVRTMAVGGLLSVVALQAWTPFSQSWNGPSWSLSVEAFFYFIFPFVLPRLSRIKLTTLLSFLFAAWAAMLTVAASTSADFISDSVWKNWIEYNPVFWSPMFYGGIALYRATTIWARVPSKWASILTICSLAVLLLLCALLNEQGRFILINGGGGPLLAFMVLAASHPQAISSRALGSRLLFEAGSLSYISYILQAPLWHSFRFITDKMRHAFVGQSTSDVQFLSYLLILLGFSYLVQRYFEAPSQRLLINRRKRLISQANDPKLPSPHIEAI